MKKTFLILSFIGIISFCSCSKVIPEANTEEEYINLSFDFTGDYSMNIDQEIKSVGTTRDDLFLISITYNDEQGKKQPYCYAMFDNKTRIGLNLLKKYKYNFDVAVCVDGYNKLDKFGNFFVPGQGFGGIPVTRDTSFHFIDKFVGTEGLDMEIKGQKDHHYWPELMVYRCKLNDYQIPESGKINFNMEYKTGKLKFIANNLKTGHIKITSDSHISDFTLTPENPIYEGIFLSSEFSKSCSMKAYYIENDGTNQLLGNFTVILNPKQTTVTTITLQSVSNEKINTNFEFNMENIDNITYPEGDNQNLEYKI